MPEQALFTAEQMTRLAGLRVLARQAVEGCYTGIHKSPHKGVSVEFREHRPYVRGDEVRSIDWKVFAKTDRLYIREFEEETNLRCTVLLDSSGSMGYRGKRANVSKHQFAIQVSASLAYLLLSQQDTVGLMTFDETLRSHVPPRGRPSHLQELLGQMVRSLPGGETEIGAVVQQIASRLGRPGLLALVSDCFCDVPQLIRAISRLRTARHEVIVFQIFDPDELDFPFQGRKQFKALERSWGTKLIDSRSLRDAYLQQLQIFRSQLEDGCRRNRVDLIPLSTDSAPADALAAYVSHRGRRR
ncbi:MAG: DUF58 domain-containing protein [Pirellulaceae bacterium]